MKLLHNNRESAAERAVKAQGGLKPNHESGNTCSCLLRDSAAPRRRVISYI
ncbi:hypothetical protein PSCICM_04410 [Pseudomonas cichorii]|uniref:Uncharacterized protein n=1 Tax=Pseudomonas cichorii TaxID=36746 RepID=A0ABQ1DTT1_PSECI|nr:hypothetical protein PSCICM_04410 [Pseudomonas cichorii]GFM94409.1 hypothetical protein PSCICP_43810 [Pseudomonas cichorii]